MPQPELSNMGNEDPRVLELELDIDERMRDLWRLAEEIEQWNLSVVGQFMRAAYGTGYTDAHSEPPEDRGRLIKDHGFRMPRPRSLPLDPDV